MRSPTTPMRCDRSCSIECASRAGNGRQSRPHPDSTPWPHIRSDRRPGVRECMRATSAIGNVLGQEGEPWPDRVLASRRVLVSLSPFC